MRVGVERDMSDAGQTTSEAEEQAAERAAASSQAIIFEIYLKCSVPATATLDVNWALYCVVTYLIDLIIV